MDRHMEEGKRLESSLEELLQDAPDSDAAAERKRLRELMARFGSLRPSMESTLGKSSIFSKGNKFSFSANDPYNIELGDMGGYVRYYL